MLWRSFLIHVKYEKQWQYLIKESVSSKYRVKPESKKSNVNDVPDWLSIVTILSMNRNTLILKCFLPFVCANLDGS